MLVFQRRAEETFSGRCKSTCASLSLLLRATLTRRVMLFETDGSLFTSVSLWVLYNWEEKKKSMQFDAAFCWLIRVKQARQS